MSHTTVTVHNDWAFLVFLLPQCVDHRLVVGTWLGPVLEGSITGSHPKCFMCNTYNSTSEPKMSEESHVVAVATQIFSLLDAIDAISRNSMANSSPLLQHLAGKQLPT